MISRDACALHIGEDGQGIGQTGRKFKQITDVLLSQRLYPRSEMPALQQETNMAHIRGKRREGARLSKAYFNGNRICWAIVKKGTVVRKKGIAIHKIGFRAD